MAVVIARPMVIVRPAVRPAAPRPPPPAHTEKGALQPHALPVYTATHAAAVSPARASSAPDSSIGIAPGFFLGAALCIGGLACLIGVMLRAGR